MTFILALAAILIGLPIGILVFIAIWVIGIALIDKLFDRLDF